MSKVEYDIHSSLMLLAGLLAIVGVFENAIWMFFLLLQGLIGIVQIVSSIKHARIRSFKTHLILTVVYFGLIILVNSVRSSLLWLEEVTIIIGLIIVPWSLAIFFLHTARESYLYKKYLQTRIH